MKWPFPWFLMVFGRMGSKTCHQKSCIYPIESLISYKKRGWGLGLSLVKRIVEDFHKGKVFVHKSEMGVGTTFRILLKV
jgi:nitrogen fixation/metabolism regulation signal transduction histidine kinase